ncbi:hypothetical protein [uncultured Pseudodesulfovibrio sp.]|uniref:hypothetical protein n=1 Tax=uncultured Pseudodesulfovibrio sp. TaxID=2035858 RepID=UPI0029C84A7A|nr:hypothetical protein [uncultured Pseudodesulfovibrio sp.]
MKYGKSLYPLKYGEHYANFHIFAKKISGATDRLSPLRPRNHCIHRRQENMKRGRLTTSLEKAINTA